MSAYEHAREFLDGLPLILWAVHCERGCSLADWDRSPGKIERVLRTACPHCGGKLAQHCVPK